MNLGLIYKNRYRSTTRRPDAKPTPQNSQEWTPPGNSSLPTDDLDYYYNSGFGTGPQVYPNRNSPAYQQMQNRPGPTPGFIG